MRRGRIFFYLAFILILGLVAVFVVYQKFMSQPDTSVVEATPIPVEMVDVIVVAQRVPRGNMIEDAVLSVVQIPRDLAMQGMFSNKNEVLGRRARFDLEAGIPLTTGMLVDSAAQLSTTGSNAALQVPRGMVAISIPITRLKAVSYALEPGDHVNVIVTLLINDLDQEFQSLLPNQAINVVAPGSGTFGGDSGSSVSVEGSTGSTTGTGASTVAIDTSSLVAVPGGGGAVVGRAELDPVLDQTFYLVPSERRRPRMVSQSLLQDVVVLQLGTFEEEEVAVAQPVEGQATPAEDEETPAPEPPKPDVITLIVTPQDAITLNYLMYTGAELNLALRASGDDSRVLTEAVTLPFLLDQYNIPVPSKLPYGVDPRVDDLVEPVLPNDSVVTPEP